MKPATDFSGVDIDAIHTKRAVIRHTGRQALIAHAEGDAEAVDRLLKEERKLIEELRDVDPSADLTGGQG